MVKMQKAYRFRAYPSHEQKSLLDRQMYLSKRLYNLLLEKSQSHYKDYGKTFTKYDMNKWMTSLKKKNPEFRELYSQASQNVADRVAKAYQNFFRRVRERKKNKSVKVGFPRFKKFVSSITYPQAYNGCLHLERKRAEFLKIGRINFVNHREIEGNIKTASIKKTKSGEWYVTISTEFEDTPTFNNGKPKVGIDLGIKEYATLSDGKKIPNPKILKKMEMRFKDAQRELSQRKKGGKNRRKSIQKIARISEHIARQREDYLHKLSDNLVNSYSFIAYEELNIVGMVRNHSLAKSITDVSWAQFIQFLCYKAESAGCRVVGVNPKNTSKMCNECGNIQETPLSERTYLCGKCSMSMDRDLNAAKNILNRATEGQSGSYASGDHVRPRIQEATVVESGTTFGGAS